MFKHIVIILSFHFNQFQGCDTVSLFLIIVNNTRVLFYISAPEFTRRLNAFEEAKAGSTVVFECQWQAFPRPTIKWYKDDEEVIENNRFRKEEGESGSTKLYIDNCRKKDEGAYKCKAENSEGVASTTGYLSVAGSQALIVIDTNT